MLLPVALFLVAVFVATYRTKGPLWAMCIAWGVALFPITTGMVTYAYLVDADHRFSFTLIGYLGAYAAGYALCSAWRRRAMGVVARPMLPQAALRAECARVLPVMRLCWWLAMLGSALSLVDFVLLGGEGLNDLAALRDTVLTRTSASIYAQIGSLLTWACLGCFAFALFFRKELTRFEFARMVLPIIGFFGLSVMSAGRQTAFQILIVSVLVFMITRAVQAGDAKVARASLGLRERAALSGLGAAMIGYMGYVAVARNDGGISDDKSEVLMRLFEFRFSPWAEQATQALGMGIRGAIVEAVVYFSSAPALFEAFLSVHWKPYWGAATFPFFTRQLERLTGAALPNVLVEKADAMSGAGVIGVGWTTSISSYIMDFGMAGAAFFIFLMGYYTSYAWHRALAFRNFYAVVIGILVTLTAVYMPLTPTLFDTNLLFLWLFCLLFDWRSGWRRS